MLKCMFMSFWNLLYYKLVAEWLVHEGLRINGQSKLALDVPHMTPNNMFCLLNRVPCLGISNQGRFN